MGGRGTGMVLSQDDGSRMASTEKCAASYNSVYGVAADERGGVG